MYGPAANGNIPEAIITGVKDPGSNPGKGMHGSPVIGKIIKKVTNGIKEAGRNNALT